MEKNKSKEDTKSVCLKSTRPVHLDKDIKSFEIASSKLLITKPVNLDEAIEIVGFGSFHYYILFICGSLFAAISISVTSVSFIIPSAQCDFQMTSVHKGVLNGASMIGMFFGCFISGYMADSKGRKYTLVVCMMIDGIFNLISSVSQIYPVLIFCKLMSGFGVSGVTVFYSYLGEFVNSKNREKFLCWMELFWTFGVILLPCIAWIVIPQTFRIEYGFFLFRSWNLFAVICSLPSIIFSCLLVKLPESPKFLLAKGKHDETVDCLKFVYRWNNKTDDEFPVTSLTLPDCCVNEQNNSFFNGLYKSILELFTSKFKVVAMNTCMIQFCCTASFYMMVLWFPELMNRFRWYETLYSGPKNMTNMCEIVSLFKIEPEEIDLKCNDEIDQSVYENILIIGIACIPTSIIVPLLVNRFGIKFFLVLSFFGSGLSAACLYFITSSFENIVLSSVFEALSSMGIGLIFCISVELFPTEYRGVAVSIGSMFGKIGAVIGNIVVGVFIDAHCMVPILVSCSFLIISGLLVLTLPKTGRTAMK
ncbi:synaptic vesicle glycoprotein 2C-like [Metopolophium dirhodum]|uniref:synaptic vesicle glycoprotein 2C-like n=1 Tax=Metopolophium dirhodum TaxID=44670 RepID=UPI0029901C42|nr:synaptic vesicle glycoprotein 2C-like [Metopolophium dirhodum]